MKRTIYIESISQRKEGETGWWYTPVSRNTKYIFNLFERCSVSCERVGQMSDEYWRLEIKGKRKNVRAAITNLAIALAGIYRIREYS